MHTPPLPLDVYTLCSGILEYSHDPNLDSSINRRAKTMKETIHIQSIGIDLWGGGPVNLFVNLTADTLNLHRLIFFMKNFDIACSCCLHCFGEVTFKPDVMTSGKTYKFNALESR